MAAYVVTETKGFGCRDRFGIDPRDIPVKAALVVLIADRAQGKLLSNDWKVHDTLDHRVITAGAARLGIVRSELGAESIKLGLRRDDAQGATEGSVSKGRPLRPLQHLDALDVHGTHVDAG